MHNVQSLKAPYLAGGGGRELGMRGEGGGSFLQQVGSEFCSNLMPGRFHLAVESDISSVTFSGVDS